MMHENRYSISDGADAQRRFWFLKIARKYVRNKLSDQFDGVFVRGLLEIQAYCETNPLIIAANHVSWWDAFLIVLLDEALRTESYCLMDRDNLDRLSFFRWIGAVPLDRGDARQCVRDLEKSVQLLDKPKRVLWIFPQGRQRPFHLRPLGLESGVSFVAQKSGAKVVPLSVSYLYAESPRPRMMVHLGAPIEPARLWRRFLQDLEKQLIAGMDLNDRFLLEGYPKYEQLLASKHDSSNTSAGARLLSRFTGLSKPERNEPRRLQERTGS